MNKSNLWIPMPRFLLRKDAIKRMTKKMKLNENKVLEIGFGAGEILSWLHSKGAVVSGIDFSAAAFKVAEARLSEKGVLNEVSLHADFSKIEAGSYDAICAFEVLEHIEDDTQAVTDWLGYLKPGGSLILSVPAHMSKWCRNDEWAGHIKRYEKNDFQQLFKGLDVEIKAIWNYGYPFILILDKLLNRSRKDQVKHGESNTDKTKTSGIDRPNKWIYRVLSKDWFLYPAYLLQRLFFNFDLGSGYLVHVKKSKK